MSRSAGGDVAPSDESLASLFSSTPSKADFTYRLPPFVSEATLGRARRLGPKTTLITGTTGATLRGSPLRQPGSVVGAKAGQRWM